MNKPGYRTELKHIITEMDAQLIRSRVKPIMQRDSHCGQDGKYFIRSLYFDTHEDKALHEKIDGVPIRDKFRIRFYNHESSLIRLEKKSKVNGSALKTSAILSKEQIEAIIEGKYDFLLTMQIPICQEFYLKLCLEKLQPKVIVDYDREAYICPWGNVRVTIDTDLRTSIGSSDLFDFQSINTQSMRSGFCILEIKYDHFLPDFIRDLVQLNNCMATAVSKYVACRILTE